MTEDDLEKIMSRIKKDGIVFTKPNSLFKNLVQKKGYVTYYNRSKRETVIIDRKKLRQLFKNNFL